MDHVKVRGIVLRETDYREADRIIDILTAERGLLTATARGARRQNNPLLPTTQALSFCDYELFHNARTGMYSVDASERVADFRRIREEVERLVCAAHAAELMVDAARDDPADSPVLFRLMAVTLASLDRPEREPLLTVRAFEFRLMCLIGFMPVLDECAVCGAPLPSGETRFGLSVCGMVCTRSACTARAGERLPVPDGTLACMRYLRDAPLDRLFSFRLDRREFDSLSNVCERFVSNQMERRYTRLDILSTL
ncbi:MAG: DNA repair protein RecO [Clostridia bacterium]|nr:DNA repair protein RecO [Clostridia bacterium]